MKRPLLSKDTLLADLLASVPQTAPLLIELRVGCIGCSMAKFCTVKEMCKQYELDLETVIKKIQERLVDYASNRNPDARTSRD
jgi:hybrid cluster-associated redox disulfide protein